MSRTAPSVLTLTSLYPDNVRKKNGIFVRERVRQLLARHPMPLTVVAPVPWFPATNPVFGRYAEFAKVRDEEQDGTTRVLHPSYFMLPRIGDFFSPLTYARAVLQLISKGRLGRVDLIDAHYFFPDGAAAVLVARKLGCPLMVTARGSDLNLMPSEFAAGRWIRWTARHVDAAAGVSQSLCDRLEEIGVDSSRIVSLPNGVDGERFAIKDATTLRRRLATAGPVVLSVGNLVPLKGHDRVIEAVSGMSGATLVIVGDGPLRASLQDLARRTSAGDRIVFAGELPQGQLVDYYNAADAMVLASSSEGMPNVVLESMSCGTPVVATATGGAREILASSKTGRLIQKADAREIRAALQDILEVGASRQLVREEVAAFDWARTCHQIVAKFGELTNKSKADMTERNA